MSRRYEHQYGLDYEMLGKLAVTQRNHALLNEDGTNLVMFEPDGEAK